MSTFSAFPTPPQQQQDDLTIYSPPIKPNDLGYYGSSDYSDNNSASSRQLKIQQRQKYVYNNISKPPRCKTNSTSSFSSVLSSPTTSSTSNSSQSPVQRQPVITNLYPYSNQLSSYLVTEVADSKPQFAKEKSLNAHLERFERIYNADEVNSSEKVLRSQRNNTYSYV